MTTVRCSLLACAIAATLGCTSVKMAVPPEVATLPVFEASDRSVWTTATDKDFGFRGYRVADVDRNGDTTTAWSVEAFANQETTGGYAFTFQADKSKLAGRCALSSHGNQVKLGKTFRLHSESAQLGCTCEGEGSSSSVVIARAKRDYQGQMILLNKTYSVMSLHKLASGYAFLDDPAGYRVDGPGPVAAVEVLYPGRVWLASDLTEPQRVRVSCLFAGLMLYRPPSDSPAPN